MNITLLTLLGILSDLFELTYEAGRLTRKYILPALVFTYVVVEAGLVRLYDRVTSLEMEMSISTYWQPTRIGL